MTVAELKRRLKPGLRLWCVRNQQGVVKLARTVAGADTAKVWFTGDGIEGGKFSYMTWPKAAELRERDGGFVVRNSLYYEWREPDFEVSRGPMTIVTPLSIAASRWLKENLGPESQWYAGGVVVDNDYVDGLVAEMEDDGLWANP